MAKQESLITVRDEDNKIIGVIERVESLYAIYITETAGVEDVENLFTQKQQ